MKIVLFSSFNIQITCLALSHCIELELLFYLHFFNIDFCFSGIGIGIINQATMVILGYYFEKRLALANGIALTAVGLSLFVIPPLAQFLIDEYGWQGALLIIAGLLGNSGIGAATFRPSPTELKIRQKLNTKIHEKEYMELQQSEEKTVRRFASDTDENCAKNRPGDKKCRSYGLCTLFLDFELLKDIKCVSLFTMFFCYSIGYSMGTIFVPARATNVGISPQKAAILVSIQGGASVVARFTHGYILDYKIMSPPSLTATANALCGLSCILNPLFDDYTYLAIISVAFGLSSGVGNSMITVLSKYFVGTHKLSEVVAFVLVMYGLGTFSGSYLTGKNICKKTNKQTKPTYKQAHCDSCSFAN